MATKWVKLTDADQELILVALAAQASSPYAKVYKKIKDLGKRITISSAKAKGRNLEQWVCQQLSDVTGIPYTPGDDNSLIDFRTMGLSGVDVILRGPAQKAFPFSVECKASESLDLVSTIDQASANVLPKTDWLIVHKRKAIAKPIVILEWDTFIKSIFIGKAYGNKKQPKAGG